MRRQLRVNRPDVIDEDFDGEAVVLNLLSGLYFSFNDTATRIWHAFDEPRDFDDVVKTFGVAVRETEVAEFLERLLIEELLIADGAPEPSNALPTLDPTTVPAGIPEFERFNDMQDLMLLDPVHDIDLAGDGWPNRTSGPACR